MIKTISSSSSVGRPNPDRMREFEDWLARFDMEPVPDGCRESADPARVEELELSTVQS